MELYSSEGKVISLNNTHTHTNASNLLFALRPYYYKKVIKRKIDYQNLRIIKNERLIYTQT